MYGRLGYVICYAAAGRSRFQFFAVPVGIAYPTVLPPLTAIIDPSTRDGWVQLFKTFVDVIRWDNRFYVWCFDQFLDCRCNVNVKVTL